METEFPSVKTKQEFVRRFQNGEFGNRGPTWDSLAEFMEANYRGLVHIRNRVAGGPTWYNVLAEDVHRETFQICSLGEATRENLYYAAMAPTDKTLIQGEVQMGSHGLELFYSTVKKPMRDALAERAHTADGITAVSLLRKYLDDRSYEWLHTLLERYSGHVVEFSTYSRKWGTLPHFNTVIWEVRLY